MIVAEDWCVTLIGVQVHLVLIGMYVLDGIQADRDSGIVNYGDNSEGEGLVSKQRVLILLLEQEILFIDLTLPE